MVRVPTTYSLQLMNPLKGSLKLAIQGEISTVHTTLSYQGQRQMDGQWIVACVVGGGVLMSKEWIRDTRWLIDSVNGVNGLIKKSTCSYGYYDLIKGRHF